MTTGTNRTPLGVAALAFFTVAALNACGGGGGSGGQPAAPPQVASIAVTPDAVTLEAFEATAQLQASARDNNGNSFNAVFDWTSADTAVATVSSSGLVTARGNGMTTVTVASGSVTQIATVTVQQRLSQLVLSAETVMLNALGAASQLEVTPQDANGHRMSADVRWSSSEPSVATVDTSGLVTAQANGAATVTVASESVTASASVNVQQQIATVMVSRQTATLESLGEQVQLNATAQDANGRTMTADVEWDSSDPAVASVDGDGLVTARGNGMTTVSASSGSVSMSLEVAVQQRLAGLTVSTDTVRLEAVDETRQLLVTARDANGHAMSADVRWRSSDDSVAVVNAGGLVTAKGHGMATVTATSGAFSTSFTVTVSLYPAIVLTPSSSLLEALGETVQLSAQVLDADGEEDSVAVHWESADPSIATVDASGRVTAQANGIAVISAGVNSRSASATVTVRQSVFTFSIEPWSHSQDPLTFQSFGDTVQFSVQPSDANGHPVTDAAISARSRNEDVVVINENLLATAVGNGTVSISFFVNDRNAGFSVRVRQVPVSIRIEPAARTFRELGETHSFTPHVTDANGYALSDDLFLWQSADRRIATVDASGVVTIRGVGETAVTLSAGERSVSATVIGELQATCESGPVQPAIVAVQPQPLVEGATVRVQGTGFCAQAAGNLVTVDRTVAEVTESSATELSVAVPQFHCLPTRHVALTVAVGQNRSSHTLALQPDEPAVSVAVGRQHILGAVQEKCLQFSAAPESEAYLIGVQSTRVPTDRFPRNALTPLRLVGTTNAPAAPPSMLSPNSQRRAWKAVPGPATVGSGQPSVLHAITPQLEPAVRERTSQSLPVVSEADLDTLPEVGDPVTLSDCPDELFVHTIGARGLWLVNQNLREFVDRHEGRISDLSDLFDTVIYPAVVDYFGVPDLGGVDRVLMVICYDHVGAHIASGNAIRTDIFVSAAILAHEFTHTVQQDHQTGFRFTDWFAEGQATLGQEVFGFTVTNRHPAQNYGRDVAFSTEYPNPSAWQDTFERLSGYFSGAYEARPQECGWISAGVAPQCGAALEYGVGWSFLRWLTDQYARQYPGGDAQFHRELLLSEQDQLGAIERLLGSPWKTLLAQWSAAMYVDDRVARAAPALQFTSWNFQDVYGDDPDRLIPQEISFEDLERIARLRDGSTWYLRVSGEGRSATAIGVENQDNTELPEDIQVWVVRLE